jgi:DNA-binding NtrC family response regulator
VLDLAGRVAATDAQVLITGESGTGKEIIAEAIHRNSPRRERPFVKVNLGGISSTLFESEMFGHVRGAFTDAGRDRAGRVEVAEDGTLLLDEIGELDPRSQVKLLRVLQDRTYEVLGSSETRLMRARVISATNRDLRRAVAEGAFREDLLYRLNVITLKVPSLAERASDIPLLASHFLARAEAALGKTGAPPKLTADALDWLASSPWPGNVRQLEQFLLRAALVAEGPQLDAAALSRVMAMEEADDGRDRLPPVGSMTVDEVEKAMIERSLRHHQGNISRAADSLGLSRPALYRRLEKYGIGP